MEQSYRNQARKALERARAELQAQDDQRLKYAAVELRMAMECLTYDRALAYKDEFPPQEYETWQPKKVLAILLDIDPTADKDVSIAIGEEKGYGAAPVAMKPLGSEKVLNMGLLRDHYGALGSYLHVQSMKKVRKREALNYGKFRKRCETIAEFVSEALSSPIYNVTMGYIASIECVECGKTVRKRIPPGKDEEAAKCHECGASYTVTRAGERQVRWEPHQLEVACRGERCGRKIVIWRHEIEVGREWTCPDCGGRNVFVIGILHEPAGQPKRIVPRT